MFLNTDILSPLTTPPYPNGSRALEALGVLVVKIS